MVKKFSLMSLLAVLACLTLLASGAWAGAPSPKTQQKQVKAMVKSAAKLIKAKGEAAFAELSVQNGPWHKGATGIFVSDEQGVELVNVAAPELVGRNLWDFKDPDGRLVVQEEWNLVNSKGKGWYQCKWVKPGASQPVPCRSYLMAVQHKGKRYLVGAAYYPEK